MKVRCLIDAMTPGGKVSVPDNDPVIIEDANTDTDWVMLTVTNKGGEGEHTSVYVSAEELIQAVKRCTNARWPYHYIGDDLK